MSGWWLIGFVAGGAVVLIAAGLLIGILWQARRIERLADDVIETLEAIEIRTRPIWRLRHAERASAKLRERLEAVARGRRAGQAPEDAAA